MKTGQLENLPPIVTAPALTPEQIKFRNQRIAEGLADPDPDCRVSSLKDVELLLNTKTCLTIIGQHNLASDADFRVRYTTVEILGIRLEEILDRRGRADAQVDDQSNIALIKGALEKFEKDRDNEIAAFAIHLIQNKN